jgi:type VI secretion system protein ImpJ
MSLDSARVVWSEGLFLRPHHFQQQERFFEALLDARLRPLLEAGYGFVRLELDSALLLQGKIRIAAANGVFQDGTPFDVPSEAVVVDVFDVPENVRNATVYLAAALQRSGVKSVSLDAPAQGGRRTRFSAVDAQVADCVVGIDSEAELKVGALRLTLGLEASLDGSLTALAVARVIERRADGRLELDPTFIPPVLHYGVSARLRSWIEELHGVVKQRGDALAARIGAPGSKGVADFVDFLLLLACNRYEPVLARLRESSPVHPLGLYTELLRLAGECATYGRETRRPPAFLAYSHTNLNDCFAPVVEEIRRAMVAVVDQRVVPIPVRDMTKGLYRADIPDPQLFKSAYFVLAAAANMPTETLRSRLPTMTRIGPPDKIREMVMSQVPGIRIEALAVAPRQLPFLANYCYFKLDTTSEYWPALEVARSMALYVAGDPPGLELQMWAIRT